MGRFSFAKRVICWRSERIGRNRSTFAATSGHVTIPVSPLARSPSDPLLKDLFPVILNVCVVPWPTTPAISL